MGNYLFRGQSARRQIKGVTDGNANKQKTATSDQKAGKGAGIQSGFMYADNLSRGRVGRGVWREGVDVEGKETEREPY